MKPSTLSGLKLVAVFLGIVVVITLVMAGADRAVHDIARQYGEAKKGSVLKNCEAPKLTQLTGAGTDLFGLDSTGAVWVLRENCWKKVEISR